MTTKKLRGEVSPASYLSPRERRKAGSLIKAIRSSRNIEEVLKYQTELEELIEIANANKAEIRNHARVLKGQDIAVVRAHLRDRHDRNLAENRDSASTGAGN